MITFETITTILKVLLGVAILAEISKKNYQEAAFLAMLFVIVVYLIK